MIGLLRSLSFIGALMMSNLPNHFVHQCGFRLLLLVAAAVLTNASANAQTSGAGKNLDDTRFKRIELKRDDREVRSAAGLRVRVNKRLRSIAGDRRFLVDIDPTRLSRQVRNLAARTSRARPTARDGKKVSYDRPGGEATEFVSEYPSLNAQLRCYWSYDRKLIRLLAAAEAKAREAALDREIEIRDEPTPTSGGAHPEGDRRLAQKAQLIPSGDPEMGDLIRVRRQFKKGGRPCQLEVLCQSQLNSRKKQSKHIGIIQRERSACEEKADQLADAMIIVRTGE